MPMTTRELLERYTLKQQLKAKSVSLYEMLLDRFDRFLGHPSTVEDFDDLVVSRYLRWRAETPAWRGRIPSQASVKKDAVMLAAIWNYAARKKWTADFPELPRIKVPKKLPVGRAYTSTDVSTLVKRALLRCGKTGGLPSAWWWATLLYAAYCTGERFEALTSLRWGELDLAARRVIFLASTRKGSTRDIERQITPDLAEMLAKHRRDDAELVWPWDRRSKSQWTSLKLLCRKAGVKYRGFHGFRRTAASYAALAGGRAAATQLLDHSDPNLQQVYVDPVICPSDTNSTAALPPLDLGGKLSESNANEASQRDGYKTGQSLSASDATKQQAIDAMRLAGGRSGNHALLWRQGFVLGFNLPDGDECWDDDDWTTPAKPR